MSSATWSPGRRPRLLIVDDQVVNIRILHKILGDAYEMFIATDGSQGLELSRTVDPDLILLDVLMPGLDGFEVCRQLKAEPETRSIPVIFITNRNTPTDESTALELGAVDFVAKPLNPQVVRARIKTHLALKAQADHLRSLAMLDALTRLPNRRQLDEVLDREWRACCRTGSSLGLIALDLDNFKSYNDHYGHGAGDEALRTVGSVLRRLLRRARDFVARCGGEEFVVVLSGVDLAGAARVAEYIRAAIEAESIPHASSEAGVLTVSGGVAAAKPTPDSTPDALREAADRQLYRAKAAGRNRIEPRA